MSSLLIKRRSIVLSGALIIIMWVAAAVWANSQVSKSRNHAPAHGIATTKTAAANRLNNLGTAYMNQQQFEHALLLFRQATQADPTLRVARLNQGIALLNLQHEDDARKLLLAAVQRDPDTVHAWYNLGLLYKGKGRIQPAIDAFTRVTKLAPTDAHTFYFLGTLQSQAGDPTAAVAAFEQALRLDPYHASAEFGIARAYQQAGQQEQARRHLARFQHLTQTKLGVPMSLVYGDQGPLSLAVPATTAQPVVSAMIAMRFTDVTAAAGLAGSAATPNAPKGSGYSVCIFDFDGDHRPDVLLARGAEGRLTLYRNRGGGKFADVTRQAGIETDMQATACAAGDYDNDGHSDFVVSTPTGIRLFRNNGDGKFTDETRSAGLTGGPQALGLTWVDYDHDGDLDLHISAPSGASATTGTFWRNNGNRTFTDVTVEAGFADAGATHALLSTDFNNDRAIDLLLLTDGRPAELRLNPREGKFIPLQVWPDAPSSPATSAAIFDFDKNGWMDLALTHQQAPAITLWRNRDGQRLEPVAFPAPNWTRAYGVVALDFDNDGWIDLAAVGERDDGTGEVRVFRNLGPTGFRDVTAELGLDAVKLAHPRGIATFDYDGDGDADLLISQQGAPPVLLRNDGGNRNHWLRLSLHGLNDNKSGFGAKIEVFAGELWQKWELSGSGFASQSSTDLIVGLGANTSADVVRILWPTGVVQDEVQLAANTSPSITEIDRRGSSCPVLFAWDGSRYRFVSDMLGAGVVGHWVAPGERNVPDPTEYLKIEGFSPAPRNGRLSFRFMEPMEETVYLDQVRLLAVDHPSDLETYPNEYFASEPPFPEFKVIASRAPAPVAHAWDDSGHDVTALLRERDRKYVGGFHLLPFKGFTRMHTLELDLGAPYRSGPLRLLLHGYIEYFTATGMFAAHQAGIDPVAPYVEALSNGRWQRVIDDMGFPAGLPRTAVADLTAHLPPGTQRIRITTNLQIYWDQILVDRTAEQPVLALEVPLTSARLRFRGYPRAVEFSSPGDLTYIYEDTSATGPYVHQIGAYTRFGDVRKLLTTADDKFVVFGSGEEVALEFDPSSLPPVRARWKRDYFFFADGYEKDMDFYAADFLTVEPLPFQAMHVYPSPDRGNYPLDEKHLPYLLEMNNRLSSGEGPREFRFRYRQGHK
jgi:tetratricopeptide (TPR) repeat protein